ncbi:hypothetical protein MIDIC_470042 [Alphaproteobacteria bacterium]
MVRAKEYKSIEYYMTEPESCSATTQALKREIGITLQNASRHRRRKLLGNLFRNIRQNLQNLLRSTHTIS